MPLIIIVIALSLLVAILLFIIWTIRRSSDPHLQFDCDASLADLIPSLAGLTYGMPTGGNAVEVFEDGAFYEQLFTAISKAEHSIHLETFLWKEGTLAHRVAEALLARSEDGVTVRIMLDAHGSKAMSETVLKRFENSSCQFVKFHKFRLRKIGLLNKRNHRKMVVIDGREAYVGGHCIADQWLLDGEQPAYRDVSVRIRGPIVHALQSTFAENWIEATGELFMGTDVFPALKKEGDLTIHAAHIRPEGGVSGVKILHRVVICCAKERIWIQNPYFLPEPETIKALGAAVDRGVDVRIMVPSIHSSDMGLVQKAAQRNYEKLLSFGIRLFEYQHTLIHQKVMTVDSSWCAIGSSNFDDRSFEINDEITLGIHDPKLAAQFESIFERDCERCKERTLEAWKQRGLWIRLQSRFLFMFKGQL